jgi:uncharacterized protein
MQIEPMGTKRLGNWRYYFRLSSFFLMTFLMGLYLTFAPMLNRNLYNAVLFGSERCLEFDQVWFGRKAREVWFTNTAGRHLHGLYLPSPNAKHVILVHHGQGGNIKDHLTACGFLLQPENSVFIYDYSGFGKSEGSPTIKGMTDDARAAYDCLVSQLGVDPKEIVNYGASLGSGVAALVAAEKPCSGLVLMSPFTSLKTVAREIFRFLNVYPDFLLTDFDFDTAGAARRLKVALLIVHGVDDGCIAVHHSDQIYAAAHDPKSYLRLTIGGHSLNNSEDARSGVLSFIHDLSN